MQTDYSFDCLADALSFAEKLLQSGEAELFRGQSFDWPTITPSLFRGNAKQKQQAGQILEQFTEWASVVPQMESYRTSGNHITAIAQHYGIPTNLLDLTTSPQVSALFSCPDFDDAAPENGVIYCFKSEVLREAKELNLIHLDVANLWRLEAQHGCFLECENEAAAEQIRSLAIRLHFPRRRLNSEETRSLYPAQKSPLEVVLDQWIYRHRIGQIFGNFSHIPNPTIIRRYTYPGLFRWRVVPEITVDWVGADPGWLFHYRESLVQAQASSQVPVTVDIKADPQQAVAELEVLFAGCIQNYSAGVSQSFTLQVKGEKKADERASELLNRCWDGIRCHPYRSASAARCLSVTSVIMAHRIVAKDYDANVEKILWGDCSMLDAAPVGGHLDSALVSRDALLGAFNSEPIAGFTAYGKRKFQEQPIALMDLVVDPWALFDFQRLARLYVEQFIPSCVAFSWRNEDSSQDELWGVPFNVALLATFTRAEYRFLSPIATEADVERLVLISSDMTNADLEEVFYSCLPSIFESGEPFILKFADYGQDERPIWQIPAAIEQCKAIVAIGGISVLEVLPQEVELNSSMQSGGLGALHIWMIAKGLAKQEFPTQDAWQEMVSCFYDDLGECNQRLEGLAMAQPDWPFSATAKD